MDRSIPALSTMFFIRYIKQKRSRKIKAAILVCLLLWYALFFPSQLFETPLSTVIEDRNGVLLGAHIAEDGQWRFPQMDRIPEKFEQSILCFEDRHFYKHPGFNPVAIGKAMYSNFQAGKVVQGGSTISQQTIRLARQGKQRSYLEKFIELIWATRMELSYSKEEILNMYASHAPFGGNVVGLEAASWRYFARDPNELSWAESATLAVLPNAPSLIYPGKNQEALLKKRNRLLHALYQTKAMDTLDLQLALLEPLPQKVHRLPQKALHVLNRAMEERKGERLRTTLDVYQQDRLNELVHRYHSTYQKSEVHNIGVLLCDAQNGAVVAYVGNTYDPKFRHENAVDVVRANRSTGSILKPFLYAAMLDEGSLLPDMLVSDIPTQIGGYAPKNYDLSYAGAVKASQALSRSLNVPAVRMLREYGLEKFHYRLQEMGLSGIRYGADHYGLPLILGGGEASLWDLCGAYSAISRTIQNYDSYNNQYDAKEWRPLEWQLDNNAKEPRIMQMQAPVFSAGALWYTYEAMGKVNRPNYDKAWEYYASSQKLAWKTGTSFGHRDAWAIGTNAKYTVGVWVGNADGEGRPDLTGLNYAAPIMLDVFSGLQSDSWFKRPEEELIEAAICRESGYKASMYCTTIDEKLIPVSGQKSDVCPYHKTVHLSKNKKFQVNTSCESIGDIVQENYFVLSPIQEWYYKQKHGSYKILPPFRSDCMTGNQTRMEFVYPRESHHVFLPRNHKGEVNELVLKATHKDPKAVLHWHLNDRFIGVTERKHQMAILPEEGKYLITIIDHQGESINKRIEILK